MLLGQWEYGMYTEFWWRILLKAVPKTTAKEIGG
jgi:hypothetical protein